MRAQSASFLATRRGVLTLLLLCAVQFLDIVDSSIMNVALPSIRSDLGFTEQNLQWVLSGYVLTYGGFLFLGGRAADLLGRRRLLVAGTTLFALSSLTGGAGPETRHDGPRRAVHPHHHLHRGPRPEPGARPMGGDQRAGGGSRCFPRRRAVGGA